MPKFQAVTPEAVRQAVRSTFHLDEMAIAVAGDAKEIEKSLKAAGVKYRRLPISTLMGPN